MRVLLAVTHLQGIGHLSRAAAIARGLARAGHGVTLVSGGLPVPTLEIPGVDLVQLPPVRIEGNDFKTILDEAGRPAGEAWWLERRSMLEMALGFSEPELLVTEHFPFGRRTLLPEFDGLIERASRRSPRPRMLASVRDVLVPPSKPERASGVEARLERFYDGVLVHGDPAFLPLEASWPVSPAVAARLIYTGYVLDKDPAPVERGGAGEGEILVSAGGSATGRPLFRAALAAAALWPAGPRWRILVGGRLDEHERAALAGAPGNAVVEPARPDFPALLARCAVSVSRGGYNTVVETLAVRARAVIVPFEEGRESEQRQRAEALARQGLAGLLREAELSPEGLLRAVQAALQAPRPPVAPFALDGLVRTVTALEAFAHGRTARGLPPAQ